MRDYDYSMMEDEFFPWLEKALTDPEFRAAYEAAGDTDDEPVQKISRTGE